MTSPKYAVFDLETTGFTRADRVVEIAVILLACDFSPINEFHTLVNPNRGMAATEVHGISADAIELAPLFGEIAGYVASIMNGCILVAHNLPFDARFLKQEFAACDVQFDLGHGIDTLKATRKNLQAACQSFSIPTSSAHSALGDARATAALLQYLDPTVDATPAATASTPNGFIRTHPRALDGAPTESTSVSVQFANIESAELSYLATLDYFLNDFIIDEQEQQALEYLQQENRLSHARVAALHSEYFQSYINAALRDHFISVAEFDTLTRIASALKIQPSEIPVPTSIEPFTLKRGMRVCFSGKSLDKASLRTAAQDAGLVPVESVTKHGCDIVVVESMSDLTGKAKSALKFKIPRLTAHQFTVHLHELYPR